MAKPNNLASLSTVIEDVPRSNFQLGQGVDALTGEPRELALKGYKTPTPSVGPTCDVHTRVIEELHQLNSDVRIALNATINLGAPAVSIKQTAQLLRSKALSKREFIVECTVEGQFDYDTLSLDGVRLSTRARKVLERSRTEFRKTYGDYFVAGFRRRYRSYTLIVCRAGENTKITDAQLEAKVDFQSLLGLGGGVKRSVKKSSKYSVVNAYVSQYGCHSASTSNSPQSDLIPVPFQTDFASALRVLSDTVVNASQYYGTPKEAILMHYSLLHVQLPTEVSVSPVVFEQLHHTEELCRRLDVDCLHPALQTYKSIVQAAKGATRAFRVGRPRFAGGDDAMCEKAIKDVQEAMNEVENHVERYKFMEDLLSKEWGPSIGEKITLGKKTSSRQAYGEVDTKVVREDEGDGRQSVTLRNGLPAFQVTLHRHWNKHSGRVTDFMKQLMPTWLDLVLEKRTQVQPRDRQPHQHRQRDEFYIVGWTIAYQKSGSSSFRVQYGGILKNNLNISVEGPDWICRIVYVLKKDYDFPDLIDTHSASH